jgi:2-C-methyl-D-erythritol 4-phosphate cytidylyltransferase
MKPARSCLTGESPVHVLIAAAGSGRRMGADGNKLLLPLAGRPVLAWTLQAVTRCRGIRWIGVIGRPVDHGAIEACVRSVSPDCPVQLVAGGETRQDSVRHGLAALPSEATGVLIHDGARCLAEPELFERCHAHVAAGEAVVAATPVTDTIKRVDDGGCIVETPDRSRLWAAQTPQGFPVDRLREAHGRATALGWTVTDDASLFERLGWPVRVLESSRSNIKLTTPIDLRLAEAVLAGR